MSPRQGRKGAAVLPQRGFALIAMLVFAAMIAAFLIAIGLNRDSTELKNDREDRNMFVLRQAKAALISYAANEQWQLYKAGSPTPATFYFQPGALPCPDKDDDGDADCVGTGITPTSSIIGRLPYKTLGIDELRDSSGEHLWYALSWSFRKLQNGTPPTIINSDTQGQLKVIGTSPANNVVAVLIAPGPPVLGQNRPPDPTNPAHNTASNYLEGFDSSDPVQYVFTSNNYVTTSSTVSTDTFNDRVLVITQADLMAAVEPVVAARIERDIKPLFTRYLSEWTRFPYPANFNPNPPGTTGPGTSGGSTNRSPMTYVGDTTLTTLPVGLVPIHTVPISNASNTSPIIITTTAPHTLPNSSFVTVYGVQGNLAANDERFVTVIDSTHLSLNGTSGNGNYTGGGAVTSSYTPSLWSVFQIGGLGRVDSVDCGQTSIPNPYNGLKCTFRARDDNCPPNPNCISNLRFQLQWQASTNVGTSLAVLPDLPTTDSHVKIDGTPTTLVSTAMAGEFVDSTGLGRVKYSATLPSSYNCSGGSCTGDHWVEVIFPDVALNPAITATDPTVGWFIANEWYRQTYYAVATDLLPGGNGDCSANPLCLTVNNLPGGKVTSGKAILLLAGRALNGSNRPSTLLTDYLEQAAPPTSTYANRTGTPTSINDRVVVLAQ